MYGDDGEEDLCHECENPFDLLCCDGPCGRAFHADCLELDASDIPPEGQPWLCFECSNGVVSSVRIKSDCISRHRGMLPTPLFFAAPMFFM